MCKKLEIAIEDHIFIDNEIRFKPLNNIEYLSDDNFSDEQISNYFRSLKKREYIPRNNVDKINSILKKDRKHMFIVTEDDQAREFSIYSKKQAVLMFQDMLIDYLEKRTTLIEK